MIWLCSRFANTSSKQSLLTRGLPQPPDAFKQRAPRGFTSHLPGSLYFLWYRFSIIVTFAGIVTKYHPFISFHIGFPPSSHLPGLSPNIILLLPLIQVPTIAFRQLRELDHVNLNQVILLPKDLLFWSNIDLQGKLNIHSCKHIGGNFLMFYMPALVRTRQHNNMQGCVSVEGMDENLG